MNRIALHEADTADVSQHPAVLAAMPYWAEEVYVGSVEEGKVFLEYIFGDDRHQSAYIGQAAALDLASGEVVDVDEVKVYIGNREPGLTDLDEAAELLERVTQVARRVSTLRGARDLSSDIELGDAVKMSQLLGVTFEAFATAYDVVVRQPRLEVVER